LGYGDGCLASEDVDLYGKAVGRRICDILHEMISTSRDSVCGIVGDICMELGGCGDECVDRSL